MSFNRRVKNKITSSPLPISFNPTSPAMGRPSKNLGHIFHSQIDGVHLHTGIVPTRTIPFTIINQIRNTATSVVDTQPTRVRKYLNAVVSKIPRSII